MQRNWPDEDVRYFNEGAHYREARFDYDVLNAPDGEVFVFLSC